MIANMRLVNWGLSAYAILGFVVWFVIAMVVILTVWTLIRMYLWQTEKELAQRKHHNRTHDGEGKPMPPGRRGICGNCGQVFDKVYFLPSGKRLCAKCLEEEKSTRK